jgi:hypothetical protein
MALQIVPIFQYYTIWVNTVIDFFMWGWGKDEGCPLFASPLRANHPGSPVAVKLENGIVHEAGDGSLVRYFRVSGHNWQGMTAPHGGVMIYAIVDIPYKRRLYKKRKKSKIGNGIRPWSTILHNTDGSIIGVGSHLASAPKHLKIEIATENMKDVLVSETILPLNIDLNSITESFKLSEGKLIKLSK